MPIYGYVCKGCEHTLDALQKIADAPLVDCPSCGEPELKRALSAPRFRLKGQGWYETDFKKDNQRNLAGDADASAANDKSDAKSDKKGDDNKSGDKSEKKTDKKAAKKATKSDKKSSAA